MKKVILAAGLLILTGCASYESMYASYTAACMQSSGKPMVSFTDSGGKAVTLYNTGACSVAPPQDPNRAILSTFGMLGKAALFVWGASEIASEGIAFGVGPGINALGSQSIGGNGYMGFGPGFTTEAPVVVPPVIVPGQ